MSTKVYGTSDDLIELEGDLRGEVNHYASDAEADKGVLLVFSDGTVLSVKYGKPTGAIWEIKALREGSLFAEIKTCVDEDADPYSDIAIFGSGLKWSISATAWERVQ